MSLLCRHYRDAPTKSAASIAGEKVVKRQSNIQEVEYSRRHKPKKERKGKRCHLLVICLLIPSLALWYDVSYQGE